MYIKHYCEKVGKRVERPFLDHHVDFDRVWGVVADVSSKSNRGGCVEHPNLPQSKKLNKRGTSEGIQQHGRGHYSP